MSFFYFYSPPDECLLISISPFSLVKKTLRRADFTGGYGRIRETNLNVKGLAISHTTATYLDILSNTYGILLFGVSQEVDKGLSNMVTSTPEAEESALVRDAKWLGKWVGKFDDVGGGTEVVYFKESAGVENQTVRELSPSTDGYGGKADIEVDRR